VVGTLDYQRPLFTERQRFTQPWLWVVLALTTILLLGLSVIFFWRVRIPAAAAALGCVTLAVIAMNGFYLAAGLSVRVDADGVHVRFPPFIRRTFRAESIAGCESETYDPIGEFGGWGIRGTPARWGWAYNVRGNRGARITFHNGYRLLIGSQRAEELVGAIQQIINSAPSMPARTLPPAPVPPSPRPPARDTAF
jgi:hypothetical protein